ncbi:MAG TPA: SUF system Fe-S cluster assembly regulator [Candidatus Binatia bacterium]
MIRIAKLTDYAIVLLTYFAGDADQVRTARDLGAQARIPLPTVCKVLKALSRGGLLVSQRGVKGGYSLARRPEEISMARIIGVIEGPIAMTECSTHPGICGLEPACPVRSNWRRINQAVQRALDTLTLADMTAPLPQRLAAPGRNHAVFPLTLMARQTS